MTGDFLLVRTGETLDYGFDWSEWLDGATIVTSSWRIGPSGPTLSSEDSTDETTKVYVEFAAAHAGKKFSLKNIITDSTGARGVEEMTLRCTLGSEEGDDPVVGYAPSLDFSDARNSQYIALLEDI